MILIVDDDGFIRKILARILEVLDCELTFATSGIEALALLDTQRPALILMDYTMPEMNGLEVTRKLKALEDFKNIPVIMLTGQGANRIVENCLDAGVAAFIKKPFSRLALLEKIKGHIDI